MFQFNKRENIYYVILRGGVNWYRESCLYGYFSLLYFSIIVYYSLYSSVVLLEFKSNSLGSFGVYYSNLFIICKYICLCL